MDNNVPDDKNHDDKAGTQLFSRAQVKNVISTIKGRINTFNPAELQQLKSSTNYISVGGMSPKVADEIKALIKAIVQKEEEEKKNLVAQIIAENQRITDKNTQVQAWKKEMLRFMETQAAYSSFDAISTEYLKQQKDRNINLDEALEITKSGRALSKELKAKLERTSKDIEEEKEQWVKIHNARITAHNEHVHHSTEIAKIDKEIPRVNHSTHADKIIFLKQKKDFHIAQREAAKTKITETAKHYDERQKEAIKIMKGQELAKNADVKSFWVDQAKVFEHRHGVHPDQAKFSIEVLEQAGQIGQSTVKKQVIGSGNTKKDIRAEKIVDSKTQNNIKKSVNDKGLGTTDKQTKQWSI